MTKIIFDSILGNKLGKNKEYYKKNDRIKRSEVRQSDVSFWGIAALISGALAIFIANLSSILPSSLIVGLHSSKIEGGNINSLRSQLRQLQTETTQIRTEFSRLSSQFTLAEQGRGEVRQRVGALESSIPAILQAVPPGVAIDSSISTASINDNEVNYQVEGGSVSITNYSLNPNADKDSTPILLQSEMPPKLVSKQEPEISSASEFGVAIGPFVTELDAYIEWKEIETKIGTLLLDLKPIISAKNSNEKQRLIAGPLNSYAEAEQLCSRIIRVGIECLPMAYEGFNIVN